MEEPETCDFALVAGKIGTWGDATPLPLDSLGAIKKSARLFFPETKLIFVTPGKPYEIETEIEIGIGFRLGLGINSSKISTGILCCSLQQDLQASIKLPITEYNSSYFSSHFLL
jgi:hypothetical protein